MMTCKEVIAYLHEISSEKYKQNVIRLGIPEKNSIGVSTGDIRKLAKKIGKSNELANQLWETGYHEAKVLAVLITDAKSIDSSDIKRLMKDVLSWDLCDHVCKNLIIRMPDYKQFIMKWRDDSRLYYKRAAFCLIAASMTSKKNDISNGDIDQYLELIRTYGDDDRKHVKKAICWALREIGKRNFDDLEKAITLAHELKENDSKHVAWIGKNALKELETLVSVDERERLISSKTKMGRHSEQV
jgi:3-methyladenine DNA glycosylase AlkD